MPLTYERAYGGGRARPPEETDRPRVRRAQPGRDGVRRAGKTAPNVEYPGMSLRAGRPGSARSRPHWRPRTRYAGTYDEAWQRDRCPLYPADLDDRFFLCSPEDQRPRIPPRRGAGELLNLTPAGRLAFVLPRVAFGFETEFRGGDGCSTAAGCTRSSWSRMCRG